MYMVIINSTLSLQIRKLRHRDVHLSRITQPRDGAAICSQATWLQRQSPHTKPITSERLGGPQSTSAEEWGSKGGDELCSRGSESPSQRKCLFEFWSTDNSGQGGVHMCVCVHAHHVDRGWERRSIPRVKKKEKEASKVCAFEGLQVISGGWKMRRENER